jgi:RNA polymerase sigma factor (sigma-70 family)
MLVVDLVVLPPIAADPVFGIPSSPDPVERVADGPRGPLGSDPHDFAGLFIKHKWSFQLHARRFLSDQRDIDEVVQEGFLKLFLAMPELETELQALAYARRTITNLCIDRYRADQRRPRLIDLESLPSEVFLDEDDTDPLIQAEDAALVREALAMLSPLHRAALIKREIEEKPLPQIAAELDIPVEQVKHVLHRARRSLRRLLVGTHVEPGVDLDLALVLAANSERAARLATPVGAGAVALLLLFASLLGLRPGHPNAHIADVAMPGLQPAVSGPVGTSQPVPPRLVAPRPLMPIHAGHNVARIQIPPRPIRVHGGMQVPGIGRGTRGRAPSSKQIGTSVGVPVRAVTRGGAVVPAVPSVQHPTPAPPTTVAVSDLHFDGNLRTAGQVRLSRLLVEPGSEGRQTLSTAIVPISGGALVLEQKVSLGPDSHEAVVTPRFEQGNQATTLVPKLTTSSVSRTQDGSLRVDVELIAASQAVVTSEVGPDQLVGYLRTVIIYAPDMSSVTSEVITTLEGQGPNAPPPPEPSDGPIRSTSVDVSDQLGFPASKEAEGVS